MRPLLILILLVIDQVTKYVFQNSFYNLVIFDINYVENYGVTFGLFQGTSFLFGVIGVIIFGILLYFKNYFKETPVFFSVLLAGILGNTIDRLFRGFVVDFIDFRFWPVFNLADTYLVVAVTGIILLELYTWYQNSFKSSKSSK